MARQSSPMGHRVGNRGLRTGEVVGHLPLRNDGFELGFPGERRLERVIANEQPSRDRREELYESQSVKSTAAW